MSTTITIKRRQAPQPLPNLGFSPLLNRIFASRDISTPEQLAYKLSNMAKADLLGIDVACELLINALEQQQFVLVIGDFDVDGATSTAVVIRALKAMGLHKIDYLVPNRFEFGYGLSPEIVDVAAKMKPDLIVTVDNGIANLSGVDRANEYNIPVLITDHHLPAQELPKAAAIVNPNLENDPFPSKSLAGVGVAFYLMIALRARLRDKNWFNQNNIAEPNLAELLDLVALGTVADVVTLDQNNRVLVEQGLKRIRQSKCVEGINALIKVGNRNISKINAADMGFVLGPRLNAAGRLEDISVGIECLLTDDSMRAEQLAFQLDQINHDRRQIEQEMKEEAFAALEKIEANLATSHDMPAGLCLYQEHWHPGVVGILASRVKEKYHRPVLVFAKEGEDTLKGSARSISGIHIRDVLENISSQHPGLIQKFGGHAMAAGLTVSMDKFDTFKSIFDAKILDHGAELIGNNTLYTDGELHSDELSMQTAQMLSDAGPWGQGFPEPLFDGLFELLDKRHVGQDKNHLKITVKHSSGAILDGIAFNEKGEWINSHTKQVVLAYKLDINEFRGRQSLQLLVDHIQPA